jgi:hypothetical protein
MSLPRAILAAAIFTGAAALPGAAQQQHMNMPGMNMPGNMHGMNMPAQKMPGMDMEDEFSKLTFQPGLGELMMAFVQPRHIKLGLAGAAQNWDYAAYELDELRETFEDIGRLIVKHGKLEIAPAVASTVKPPLDALDAAIKAKDAAAFAKAYADLTAGCNACHQSAGHAMVVIQVPTVSGTAFPDQDFRPQQQK